MPGGGGAQDGDEGGAQLGPSLLARGEELDGTRSCLEQLHVHRKSLEEATGVPPRRPGLDVEREQRELRQGREVRQARQVVQLDQPQQQRPQLACAEVELPHRQPRVVLQVQRLQPGALDEEGGGDVQQKVVAQVQLAQVRQAAEGGGGEGLELIPPEGEGGEGRRECGLNEVKQLVVGSLLPREAENLQRAPHQGLHVALQVDLSSQNPQTGDAVKARGVKRQRLDHTTLVARCNFLYLDHHHVAEEICLTLIGLHWNPPLLLTPKLHARAVCISSLTAIRPEGTRCFRRAGHQACKFGMQRLPGVLEVACAPSEVEASVSMVSQHQPEVIFLGLLVSSFHFVSRFCSFSPFPSALART
mmetsp:Transcript_41612/g.131143  ORF Transcript_41612/g.131143 Transcript_41612/m.131143 type:complete len:360 (-) Transcript_41612:130-1209(-)